MYRYTNLKSPKATERNKKQTTICLPYTFEKRTDVLNPTSTGINKEDNPHTKKGFDYDMPDSKQQVYSQTHKERW